MVEFNFKELESCIEQPPLYVFRSVGKVCYPRLAQALRDVPEGEVLLVTIPERIVIDYSFIDETLGRLLNELIEGAFGDRFLLVSVSEIDQLDNLNASYRTRGIQGVVQFGGEWRLIGVPEGDQPGRSRDELLDTFNRLRDSGKLTARQLAQSAGIGFTAAGNRLSRLYQARLARRLPDSDSKGYVYVSLV